MKMKKDFENKVVFNRAVVAAAFSPRLVAVLNEAHRLLKFLGTWPIIVHVGEDNPSNHIRLEEAVERSEFRDHPPICLVRSGHPAEALIGVAHEYDADLIVAGALKKEGLFKYYLGSVARKLARNAPMSVLLQTDPQVKPQPLRKIHCAVEYDEESKNAVQIACSIAALNDTRDLYVTHSFRMPGWEEKKNFPVDIEEIRSIYHSEDTRLEKFLKQFKSCGLPYHMQSIYENSRSTTLNFTRQLEANMLIVPASKSRTGLWNRIVPHDMELALQNLPCSLLLVRKSGEIDS